MILKSGVVLATLLLLLGSFSDSRKSLKHPAFTGAATATLRVLYCQLGLLLNDHIFCDAATHEGTVKCLSSMLKHFGEEVPHLDISGETYPPPRINEIMSNVMFAVRMFSILLLLAGNQVLPALGIQNPPWIYTWAQENKMTAFILIFLVGGQIEGQLLSTGAFEVYLNDQQVWSKLDSGRLPSLGEVKELIDSSSPNAAVS